MAKVENDLDIYYEVWNANYQRQEYELAVSIKKIILQDGSWSQQILQ